MVLVVVWLVYDTWLRIISNTVLMGIYEIWISVVVYMICSKIGRGATAVMSISTIAESYSINVEVKE